MYDDLGRGRGDPGVDGGGVGHVHDDVPDAFDLGGGEAQVRTDHLLPGSGQAGHHRGAEEAVAAGDEDGHAATSDEEEETGVRVRARQTVATASPAMMSQIPHQAATSAIPPSPSK